jgi:hypothetical protein
LIVAFYAGSLPVLAQNSDNKLDLANTGGNPTSSQHSFVERYLNLKCTYKGSGHTLPHTDTSENGYNTATGDDGSGGGGSLSSGGSSSSSSGSGSKDTILILHLEPHPMNPENPVISPKTNGLQDFVNNMGATVGEPKKLSSTSNDAVAKNASTALQKKLEQTPGANS